MLPISDLVTDVVELTLLSVEPFLEPRVQAKFVAKLGPHVDPGVGDAQKLVDKDIVDDDLPALCRHDNNVEVFGVVLQVKVDGLHQLRLGAAACFAIMARVYVW